jgi:hypothetical protein
MPAAQPAPESSESGSAAEVAALRREIVELQVELESSNGGQPQLQSTWQSEVEPPEPPTTLGIEKFLGERRGPKFRDVEEAKPEPWLHGEILFERTGTVTKFLVVPDHVEDPEEVLQVMLGDWGMPMPNMTISVSSATNYFNPVNNEARDSHWEEWPTEWTCGKDGDSGQKAAAAKFKSRMSEMMYGICRAATESKGWIVSSRNRFRGAKQHGGLVDPGVRHFKKVQQGQARDLVNVAFGNKTWSIATQDGKFPTHNDLQSSNCGVMLPGFDLQNEDPDLMKRMWDAVVLRIDEKSAVTLDKKPNRQLIFPDLGEAGDLGELSRLGTDLFTIRTECSHMIFCKKQQLNDEVKILTEDLVPHVSVVVSGKDNPGTWNDVCDRATRGAQIILLENSGKVVNEIVERVKIQRKRDTAQISGGSTPDLTISELEWKSSVKTSSFIIFDALTDSPDEVIEKLTSALATVGGDEMREMGFAQTEQKRLKYAWELVVLFRHNAAKLKWQARALHIVITLTAVLTTVCAVLLSASKEESQHQSNSTTILLDESIVLSPASQAVLALACSAVPMISAFLLSLAHKFSFSKRWALMVVAAERVTSEIYLYRARVGDYQQRTKNAKLATLVTARKGSTVITSGTKTNADDKSKAEPKTPAKNSREVFADNLHALQSELMSSEVKMASLQKPPPEASKALLYDTLYPFDKQTQQARSQKRSATKHEAGVEYEEAGGLSRSSNLLLEEGLSDFNLLGAAMEEDAVDDGIGLISAHDYMRFRLLPAISRLNKAVPRHEWWYNSSQILILLATMMASVFGVLGLHTWIPIVAAVVAGVQSVSNFDDTSARLIGTNGALTQLKNLRIWWQSLSRTQQSLPHNKVQLIESSEDAIESEISAWTQGMLRKKRKVDAAEEEEEDASGLGDKRDG